MSEKYSYKTVNGLNKTYEVIEKYGQKVSVDFSEEILAERYRPRILEDLILEKSITDNLKRWIKDNNVDNIILFSHLGGSGKSSIVSVLTNSIDCSVQTINASLFKNVSDVKEKLVKMVSTNTTDGSRKIINLEETGGMNKVAIDSLKAFIEENSHIRFILTTNSIDNLSQPFKSRFITFDMNHINEDEKVDLMKRMIKRIAIILENEGVEFDNATISKYVKQNFPSYREMITNLKPNIIDGKFELVTLSSADSVNEFLQLINDKKFIEVVKKADTINVPHFIRMMHLNKLKALEDNENLADLIHAMNDLQKALSNSVAFPSISLSVFASNMIKSGIKFNTDLTN